MDWGKIAVVLFAIAAVAYCSSVTSDPEPTTPSTSAAPANALPPCPGLREHVLKTASIVKKITDIRCKADGDGYTLSVIYGESPSSMNQVESLSKATAVGVVAEAGGWRHWPADVAGVRLGDLQLQHRPDGVHRATVTPLPDTTIEPATAGFFVPVV